MFGISRVMVIGWLTLAAGLLTVPQVTVLIPDAWLGVIAAIAGILTLTVRWLSGRFGTNPLTAAGIFTFVAGVLGIPELMPMIPLAWMPYVTAIAAVLTLITRVQAGMDSSEPTAQPVGIVRYLNKEV